MTVALSWELCPSWSQIICHNHYLCSKNAMTSLRTSNFVPTSGGMSHTHDLGAGRVFDGMREILTVYSFAEATEPLLTLGLIKRDRDTGVFSCHRMVQTQFRNYFSLEDRQKAFDHAAALVYHAFPKQSDATNMNQLYQKWSECNRCLPHVLSLKEIFKEERENTKSFKVVPLF